MNMNRPVWIPPPNIRYKIMNPSTTSSPQNERSVEEAREQVHIPDLADTFLARLYSNCQWDETVGGAASEIKKTEEQKKKDCLPQSFSPVYSVGKQTIGPMKSRHLPLEVEEAYINKQTPIQWTDEYMRPDLREKIEAYNKIARRMEISLHENGIDFRGDIRVNIDFNRPVEIVERSRVNGIAKTAKSTNNPTPALKMTEKILPPNTTEVIHIDSKTTARQMIVKLFKMLRMVNYPREYSLYEYEPLIDETSGTLTRKFTRISDDACPLKVVLNWPIPHCGRALVLQEKDTKDIQGDTGEVDMRFIYAKAVGLNSWQVEEIMKEKFPTRLFETTFSRKTSSKLDCKTCKDTAINKTNQDNAIIAQCVAIFVILPILYFIVLSLKEYFK